MKKSVAPVLTIPKDRITETDPSKMSDREHAIWLHKKLEKKIDDLVAFVQPIHDVVKAADVFRAIHDINNKLTGYAELTELLRGYADEVAKTAEVQRKTMLEQQRISKRLDLAGVPQGETNGF